MTREQAIERLTAVSKNTGATAALVDSLVALDLLKLDPPPEPKKSAHEIIVTRYEIMSGSHHPYPIPAGALATTILNDLRDAGYLTSA